MIESVVQPGATQGATFVGTILAIAVALYVGYAVLERAITPVIEAVTEA
ncbi:hypothetical protein JCM17823_04250 [Halorubrum gandharaense]